ncbi:hypothetical protein RO3G_01869 [Rhizopus delemar RA 99-880]|uniref:Uncharacterized protein n=1 Tax=Rhizopus delemar (strain RA 99-880 / ATCC MYA-4621 / FGSC 9543 / NRRL 43880) TaxID=246409 RepID=I1BLT5_RHIO9|nr:hypothetical protein RO3G_01869 [Rhizopus delemar RA 99-880]|eukprot:EIE77165.1 hypothetical protein RO3G_01869 [Rhizopus delemar RA 99-880]
MSNYASSPFNERDLDTIDEITGKLEHICSNIFNLLTIMFVWFRSTLLDFPRVLIEDFLEGYPAIKK